MRRQRARRVLISITALLLIALCAACGRVELYSNLGEEDANGMLVLLNENGIRARKKKEVRQNEVFFSIVVSADDTARARSLLLQHRLPRRKQLGLTGVYKDKGLIPTPDEQKARFLLALKGEIINSLERIPDVIDADAVLNIPSVDEFADPETKKLKRPTASVVMGVKPEAVANQTVTEAKVQQFVANAVEGLNPRDVTVIISYLPVSGATVRPGDVVSLGPDASKTAITPLPVKIPQYTETLIGLSLDEPSKSKLKVYLLFFFVILLLLSAVLILAIIKGSRMRRELVGLREGAGQPAVEGQVMSEGPPQLGSAPRSGYQGPSGYEGGEGSREEVGEEMYEEGGEDDEELR